MIDGEVMGRGHGGNGIVLRNPSLNRVKLVLYNKGHFYDKGHI